MPILIDSTIKTRIAAGVDARLAASSRPAQSGGAAERSAAASALPSAAVREMMIRLPGGMLRHCAERFPHLLERIAADWADPARLQATIDSFVYDRRGDRGGFPFEVLDELAELRACHERWVGSPGRAGR